MITAGFIGLMVFEGMIDECGVEAATTRYVGTGQTYSKIQDAINASSYGDTVYVYSEVYQENLSLKDGIKLIGQFPNRPVLDGTNITGGPYGRVIIIPANDTIIEGFILKNGDIGIFKGDQGNCKNVSVSRNVFQDQNWTGIHNWNGSAYKICNNVFKNIDYATYSVAGKPGLGLLPSNDTISNNIYDNCYDGIYGPTGIQRIVNNIFVNCKTALSHCDTSGTFISNNLFWNNTVNYASTPSGNNDLYKDPKFIDNSYHISWDSPAIDAGCSEYVPTIDIDGDIRPYDGDSDGISEIDIGIDEKVNNTIYVDDDAPNGGDGSLGHPFNKIQDAINQAFQGFSIMIWEGTYQESIIVTKTVRIIGNGTKNTIINGGGNGNILHIKADYVNITGLKITNNGNQGSLFGYYGIYLDRVRYCKIQNINIERLIDSWDDGRGIFVFNSNNNIIVDNYCINGSNIKLSDSNFNSIINNTFIKCEITTDDSNSNVIKDNIFLNHSYGILLHYSHSNTIINNTCRGNLSINLYRSNSNLIQSNKCYNNHGIFIRYSINNMLQNNKMTFCGILILGDLLEHWNTHVIDTTNTVNDKPVYYWKNQTNGIIPSGAGEVILANCRNITISEQNLSNGSVGILLGFTSHTMIFDTTCSNNYINGIHFYSSSDNIINNCSILFNSRSDLNLNSDFYFDGDSKNNVAINTTFNTTIFEDLKSELIVKNYLHIQINDSHNKPISDVDVKVRDNGREIYTTSGFQGNKQKTNLNGQIKWILVTDRIFKGSTSAVENITTIYLKYENEKKINLEREVNMSTSHFEYFIFNFNQLPNKINLKNPINNSIINNSTPEFKWYGGIDKDGDQLTYCIQIIDEYKDWNSLLASQQTEIGVLSWSIFTPLTDGDYFWRVCANDGIGNGPWSNIWKFTIDIIPPNSEIIIPINNGYYNNLNTISGLATDLMNGTGIKDVEICIKQLSDNYYWDGSTWTAVEFWLPVLGTNSWSYNSSFVQLTTDTYYNIRSHAIDNVSNLEIPGLGITFMYDNKSPETSILINNNDKFTNSTNVILSLNAFDSGSGVSNVAYSTNENIWTVWEEYDLTKSFELIEDDGDKKVLFKVKDKANNSAIIHDSIILDTAPPHSLSVIINQGAYETNATSVTLALYAIDDLSGVDQMSFSNDSRSWSSWENYSTIKIYNLPSSHGEMTIYFKIKDKAGNIADTISGKILLNITTPKPEPEITPSSIMIYWVILIIIIILIIILIVGIAIAKRKKQFKNEPEHDLPSIDAINVKTILSSTSLTTDAQLPAQQIVTQPLTIPTIEPSTPTFTPKPITTSSIAVSSKPQIETLAQAQVPPQQISQPVQIPQLPSVQSQIPETMANLPQTSSIQSQPESSQPKILPEASPSVQQSLCSTCGQTLTLIPQNNKNYCYQCQKYA